MSLVAGEKEINKISEPQMYSRRFQKTQSQADMPIQCKSALNAMTKTQMFDNNQKQNGNPQIDQIQSELRKKEVVLSNDDEEGRPQPNNQLPSSFKKINIKTTTGIKKCIEEPLEELNDCSQDKLEIQGNEPFKIILIGDSGVGKTHLVNQYVKGSIPKNVSPTIGVEFATKLAKIDNEDVKAQFWDTGGQERYRSITSQHYRKSAGALIVYDITKQQSFDNVQKWADDLKYQAEPDIKIILVGNKLDLVNNKANLRKVKKEDAQKFASSNGMKFIECSAIKNQAVTQAFEDLLKEVARAKKKKGGKTSTASSPIKISTETNSSTTKCKCCPTN